MPPVSAPKEGKINFDRPSTKHGRVTLRPRAVLPPSGPGEDPFRGLAKISALGIKVSNHRAWHGVALNVAMDLEPFGRIDPCGYAGLRTIDLRSLGVQVAWPDAAHALARQLALRLA